MLPTLSRDTRDRVFALPDCPTETVEVPEWKCCVRLRGLTAGQREAYESSIVTFGTDGSVTPNPKGAMAKLLVQAIVDEKNVRIFGDDETDELAKKSGQVITRLFLVAQRLSGMGSEGLADAKNDSGGAKPDDTVSRLRSA